MKSFATTDLRTVPPIEIEIGGQVFRVPHKQRHDIVRFAATGVTIVDGERRVDCGVAQQAISQFIASKVWDPEALDPEADASNPEAPTQFGAWVDVDDKVRWQVLCADSEHRIEDQTFGDVLMYLVERVAQVPTIAPA